MISFNELPVEGKRIYVTSVLKNLADQEETIRTEWLDNNRCSCCKRVRSGKLLNCEHVKSEIDSRMEEKRKKIIELSTRVLNQELFLLRQESHAKLMTSWQVL